MALDEDLDLSGFENWNPIGTEGTSTSAKKFAGTFDGQGHTIKGMKISGEYTAETNVGLFSSLAASAVIRNVHMTDVSVAVTGSGVLRAGGVAGDTVNGTADAGTWVDRCSVGGTVSADSTGQSLVFAAGIIGRGMTWVKVSNSWADVDTSAISRGGTHSGYAGGVFGMSGNNTLIVNCASFGASYGCSPKSTNFGGMAADRVMKSVTNWLERKLRLKVRQEARKMRELFIILHCSIEIAVLLSILQDNYNLFKSWHSALERILLEGGTLQKMVELTEPVLKAPLLVYDPSLKLVGRTMNIQTNDRIYNEVIRQGYLSDKAIEYFRSANAFQVLNLRGNVKAAPDQIKGYHDYILRLQDGNETLGYGVLLQSDTNQEYQVYIFQEMCRQICSKLKQDQHQSAAADYLLRDILNRTITEPEVIRERVKYVGLDYEGNYVLLLLSFQVSNNVPVSYAANVFKSLFPSARVFLYQNDILTLMSLRKLSETKFRHQMEEVKRRLEPELGRQKMKAVASKSFRTIADIGTAYEQCRIGLLFGRGEKDFVYYEDHWLRHMLYLCDREIPLTSFCEPVIWEIAAEKKSGAVPPLTILRTYLENDRNLTYCAKTLHMHRNNVLYHITRLAERYNLNLDDSEQRLRLLISLKIYEYQ